MSVSEPNHASREISALKNQIALHTEMLLQATHRISMLERQLREPRDSAGMPSISGEKHQEEKTILPAPNVSFASLDVLYRNEKFIMRDDASQLSGIHHRLVCMLVYLVNILGLISSLGIHCVRVVPYHTTDRGLQHFVCVDFDSLGYLITLTLRTVDGPASKTRFDKIQRYILPTLIEGILPEDLSGLINYLRENPLSDSFAWYRSTKSSHEFPVPLCRWLHYSDCSQTYPFADCNPANPGLVPSGSHTLRSSLFAGISKDSKAATLSESLSRVMLEEQTFVEAYSSALAKKNRALRILPAASASTRPSGRRGPTPGYNHRGVFAARLDTDGTILRQPLLAIIAPIRELNYHVLYAAFYYSESFSAFRIRMVPPHVFDKSPFLTVFHDTPVRDLFFPRVWIHPEVDLHSVDFPVSSVVPLPTGGKHHNPYGGKRPRDAFTENADDDVETESDLSDSDKETA